MDTKRHNLRFTSHLANFFSKQQSTPLQVNVASIAKNTIEKDSIQCFYNRYRTVGGESLPKEVVNMAIQKVQLPGLINASDSIQKAIFLAIAEQFEAMNISSSREIWRLSCIVSKEEYGFKVPFINWYFSQLFR